MFNLGIDIGYSNLKLAYGDKWESVQQFLLPAGVMPADEMGEFVTGEKRGVEVEVNGKQYVAGIPQSMVGNGRVLFDEYYKSTDYMALYLAGLYAAAKKGGHTVFDSVVTGLPSFQYQEKEICAFLKERLVGTFVVQGVELTVKSVKVTAQPVGAFTLHWFSHFTQRDMIKQAKVLVIDNGYFSFDWVLIKNGAIDKSSCASSKAAVSRLLEKTKVLFKEKYGRNVDIDRLEQVIREGKSDVLSGAEYYPIRDLLAAAANDVVTSALGECHNSLRRTGASPDIVVLAGGGAGLSEMQVQKAFPEAKIEKGKNPVMSNALGYFALA